VKAITETKIVCRELAHGRWFDAELIRRAMDACGVNSLDNPGLTAGRLGARWVDEGFCSNRLDRHRDGSWHVQVRFY
jgi:hypothetical protein